MALSLGALPWSARVLATDKTSDLPNESSRPGESHLPLRKRSNRSVRISSCSWVRRKYFGTLGHRHWVFATTIQGYNGERRILALLSATDTRTVQHVRVESEANPFDPTWDSYFEAFRNAPLEPREKPVNQ
jgi:hypothetical protein